ncbi:MAG: HAD-IIIA family hydrolase [Bacteroidales bacterium]|nr:HAD-IIIA family hydrolase [Bacteroidales bacterium]
MQAVILAGGKGTRLAEFTSEIPKSMLKIGDRPLLQHQIALLKKHGIHDIIILVNYLKDVIMHSLGDGKALDVTLTYFEEKKPLGTVGGIKEIENRIQDDFLVLYGDVMINMDINRLLAYHRDKASECTLVLHPNDHPFDSDLVEMNADGRIVAFHPKPHPTGFIYNNLVNAGVYVFSPVILKFLEKGKKADFGRQVFPAIYKDIRMYGYRTSEYLKDMGTPERFLQVNADWLSGKIAGSDYTNKKKAIFFDRDGVLNKEKNFISRPEDLELYEFTPKAIRRVNQSGYLAVVVTNQSAIARNLCTIDELETIHRKLETNLGDKGAWLDAIYYCPHHPDKGYPEENPVYKINCDCRKPKTGMFKRAAEDFNIDLSGSMIIGDSERDIQAGINAGCVTIGVRTGYGIKKTTIMPDYFFEDLKEAVDFILDEPYKELFKKVFERYSQVKKQPFVISVAGNARSGKSTLASYLQLKFREMRLSTRKIELDHWIVPENQRENCQNVYDRFQLDKLVADINRLLSGDEIVVSSYSNHPERQSQPLTYSIKNADILIIDGIVALSHESLCNISDHKIFMEIPEGIFYQRFIQYYQWRGRTEQEAKHLIEKRKTDEYQLIEKESKFADLVINPFSA